MAPGLITSWQIEGEKLEVVTDFIFLDSKITANSDCIHEIKTLAPWKESYYKPRQHIKKQRHHFADKGPSRQSYGFSSGHVWMWKLDHKEGWGSKNWYFQIVVLEKILEGPLDCKGIKSINPKINQPWLFIGRTYAEAPRLWPPNAKNQLMGKDPDAGNGWGWKKKRAAEDEMVR